MTESSSILYWMESGEVAANDDAAGRAFAGGTAFAAAGAAVDAANVATAAAAGKQHPINLSLALQV